MIRFFLVCALVGLLTHSLYSQNTQCNFYTDSIYGQKIYNQVDSLPKYDGEENGLLKYIIKNLDLDRELFDKHFSRVFIFLLIDEKGCLRRAKIIRGGNNTVNPIILNMLFEMEAWTPAFCGNKPVSYEFFIPLHINFRK